MWFIVRNTLFGYYGQKLSKHFLVEYNYDSAVAFKMRSVKFNDAKQAKKYVDYIMPDVVIPMHFKTLKNEMDIDKIDEFLGV